MMRAVDHARTKCQPRSADEGCERAFALSAFFKTALFILFLTALASPAWAGVDMDITSAPGGVTITTVGTLFETSFGTLNALGIGTPMAGVTAIPLSNGTLYLTTFGLFPHGGLPKGHNAIVTAYVSANFGHPSALILESCPTTSSCNSASQYSVMSTNSGAQTTVAPAPGIPKGNTATAGLAIFVPDNNGAGAFSGADTASITFTMIDSATGTVLETDTLSLNNPVETLQTAVQLTLRTAAGGLTVAPGSDYSMNFGNVNGLGIGPGAGLTTVSAAGGIVYSTPYLLNPAFTDFAASTATITVYVSTNFAHPAVLKLEDSAAGAGPYAAISTTAGAPTLITTTAGNRTSIARSLGLFVSLNNSVGPFLGADNATLTFTMTVP